MPKVNVSTIHSCSLISYNHVYHFPAFVFFFFFFLIVFSVPSELTGRKRELNSFPTADDAFTKRQRISDSNNHNIKHKEGVEIELSNSNNAINHNVKSVPPVQIKQEKDAKLVAQKIMFLKDIGAYTPPNFIVKGKINHIAPIKHIFVFGNPKDYFYAVIIDAQGTEKKINFWGPDAIKYQGILKKNVCYEIKRLRPYQQNRVQFQMYGKIELTCQPATVFTAKEESDDDEIILLQKWNFVRNIKQIATKPEHAKLDVLGYVANLEDAKEVTTQHGNTKSLRKFEIVDQTARIEVALWDGQTEVKMSDGDLIALKSARVTKFKGKSLALNGYIEKQPQHSMVDQIKQWRAEKKKDFTTLIQTLTTLSSGRGRGHDWTNAEFIDLQQADTLREQHRSTQRMPVKKAFKIKAGIDEINNNMWYTKDSTLYWRLKITLKDEQDRWLTCAAFRTPARKLFNDLSAEEASKLQIAEPGEFTNMIEKVKETKQEYTFFVYVKENNWNPYQKYLDFIIEDFE